MKLSSLRIRHYKSLDDVLIHFEGGVTVLVGPNAVGKSNLVDSLRFIRDAVASDLEHAVSTRGGIARVRQYSKTKPFKLSVHLDVHQDELRAPGLNAQYEFAVESLTSSNYIVDHERASLYEMRRPDTAPKYIELSRDRNGQTHSNVESRSFRLAQDQLALASPRSSLSFDTWSLEHFIANWRFCAIYPNRLREPSTPDKDTNLAEDGRNWASVIKALRRSPRSRPALERIFEAMRSVIPSFEEVAVNSVGSYLVPSFRFRTGAKSTVTFDPVQLSDGTLRIFGILLALYQTPSPQFLVIEEPEQTVHPGVLGVLADAFKEASEATQIVVTTHSPNFIDYFQPEEIRVVSLDGGLTKVGNVKKTQVEAVKRKLMTLQEFMLAEGLVAEGA